METEPYLVQNKRWPKFGRFILAQYTDEAILVYQAFKPEIGRYAVEHQRFVGCPEYSLTRMSWIKTSFLWMMFRSGWGQKSNQKMVLGIWLKRSAFDWYISIGSNKEEEDRKGAIVRLQWDPDHDPSGTPLKNRRAIQLGLKKVQSFANGDDILRIDDMTEFVAGCTRNDLTTLITPKEVIYVPANAALVAKLGLSQEIKEEASGSMIEEEPLRVTLCHKGRRKIVLLQPRTMAHLYMLIQQKLRVKAKTITDSKGKDVSDQDLKTLQQDAVLNVF